jgi:hypothetical protein
MHISQIGIDFFLNFAYVSDVRVGFLLLGEIVRCIVSLILGLDQGSHQLSCVFGAARVLEMNHVVAAMREFTKTVSKKILHYVSSRAFISCGIKLRSFCVILEYFHLI